MLVIIEKEKNRYKAFLGGKVIFSSGTLSKAIEFAKKKNKEVVLPNNIRLRF